MSKTAKKINFKEKLTDDYLDLSLCGLESVPVKEIVELTKVRRLNLSYNQLTHLPDDFIKLQNIKEIDLSKNKLKSLPRNFGALSNLKNLDLLGNELNDLPATFLELKNLQWLDLKDNPLNPELKKAAGDCLDERQCKKCAVNVMSYVRVKAAEEDRQRQIEAKRRKELELKREAEAREKANQLKLQKKQEREQKRLLNEQKKKQHEEEAIHSSEEESLIPNDFKVSPNKSYQSKTNVWSSFISGVLMGLICMLLLVTTYILATSYCRLPSRASIELRRYNYVRPALEFIDDKICPYTDKNSEFFSYIIRTFQTYAQ